MKITQEGDYALRVVLFFSKLSPGEKIEARVMSESACIPLRFLLKLLRKLTVAGILRSCRGVGGGYILAKPPAEISLFDVITAIDGPINLNKCLYDPALCTAAHSDICEVHRALGTIQERFIKDLQSVTFEKIIAE
ncbi:Rrf2 family transcriptional regulator [Oscillospiraceae bacterium CM]|nr:Rrf2 family transcriptional regulator [Oscillospiraceae bacterium CM]